MILKPIKLLTKRYLGLDHINRRLEALENLMHNYLSLEASEKTQERSKIRWISATPDEQLTWEKKVSGRDFVKKIQTYGPFAPKG